MEKGKTYKLDFTPMSTANTFLAGHRIRVEVTSSSFPKYGRNLNTGGRNEFEREGVVATNLVRHTGSPARAISCCRLSGRRVLPVRLDTLERFLAGLAVLMSAAALGAACIFQFPCVLFRLRPPAVLHRLRARAVGRGRGRHGPHLDRRQPAEVPRAGAGGVLHADLRGVAPSRSSRRCARGCSERRCCRPDRGRWRTCPRVASWAGRQTQRPSPSASRRRIRRRRSQAIR